MNRTTTENAILIGALLGVLVLGQPRAAGFCRYIGSGDYNDLYSVTGTHGWGPDCPCPGGLPCTNDIIRVNWGDNTVTLTNVVTVAGFQIGVDESGRLVVASGGGLITIGTSPNSVGRNGTGVTGQLTVYTNGFVNSSFVLEVGDGATGILTVDGGTVNLSHHLWVGSTSTGKGTIILTNGGTLNMLGPVNGMLGLGTINASSPSGGIGTIKVSSGSTLNLFTIDASGRSIWPSSVLDISGSGVVTIPNDRAAIMSSYVAAGKITAYGGTGTVAIDYNASNPGKTTLKAVGGYVAPTACAWIATNGLGLWSEPTNWSCGYRLASVTKATFNVPGTIPCIVNVSASADSIDMGTNGPGGTLIITNTGILSCGGTNASFIGNNSNALMVVENGGVASFSAQLRIGFDAGADGMLLMNGGTVSVSGMFDLGYQGGKGTAQIKGGTLNLAQFDDLISIQGASVLDVTGTGQLIVNGDHRLAISLYISTGQVTNSSGAGLVVDYNLINPGKTTVYPSDLVLSPAQAIWNPALNPSGTGLWSESANWTSRLCPGDATHVIFNIPDAIPCLVSQAAVARYVEMGNNSGPGGTLIVTNGGSLTTGTDNSSTVGYSSNALMIVANGASVNFGYHLWIGFGPGADGTLIIDAGTVSVGGMLGLGWNGGKGTVIITNGGRLIGRQWHPTASIQGESVLDITGTGTVLITGNYVSSISNFVYQGKITANGRPNVAYGFDSGANETILQVAPPRQPVTAATASGGHVTLTYQTTAGLFYHIESTPSLSPASWTRVTGSTTNATGTSVTFTFPTSGAQGFYRTASP